MRILLHVCCAPCGVNSINQIRQEGHVITGYFYNPNIHPYREYKKRLETLSQFSKLTSLDVIYEDDYDIEGFLKRTAEDFGEPGRCAQCYYMRLAKASEEALKGGYDAFSSTLLISPYQKHELIVKVANEISEAKGIPFYYQDLRPGWQEGVRLSKEMGLYRQPYCGCIFSERDRYRKAGNEHARA